MIRQDYIMRLVAELAQVLGRVISLKRRQEYEAALREIGTALRQLRDAPDESSEQCALEDWIALCRRHGEAASDLMLGVADLLREQGDIFARQDRAMDSHQMRARSLGLLLEALLSPDTFVSTEALDKVDELLKATEGAALPPAVLGRL